MGLSLIGQVQDPDIKIKASTVWQLLTQIKSIIESLESGIVATVGKFPMCIAKNVVDKIIGMVTGFTLMFVMISNTIFL